MSLNTRVTDVRHNAETGNFEANVTLIDGTDSYTFAVEYSGAIDRDFDQVQAALVARARRRHWPANCVLTRRRVAEPLPDRSEDMAKRILFSQPSFLDQFLGRSGLEAVREA